MLGGFLHNLGTWLYPLFLFSLQFSLVTTDFGDLCRCACDDTQNDLTILLPSSNACVDCVAATCRHSFPPECSDAVQVTADCINRTSAKYRVAISFYYLSVVMLVCLIFMMHYFPEIRYLLKIDTRQNTSTSPTSRRRTHENATTPFVPCHPRVSPSTGDGSNGTITTAWTDSLLESSPHRSTARTSTNVTTTTTITTETDDEPIPHPFPEACAVERS